jgi:hypothetical protein
VPTKREIDEHGQLGLYQVLLRESPDAPAADDVAGAALIQLRKDAGADDPGPKAQVQPALTEGSTPTWVHTALGEAVYVLRTEAIAASEGKQCNFCAFTAICPAKNPTSSLIELDVERRQP